MKRLNSDFSKAKVGDPVYHLDGRIGRINSITPSLVFPISVRWDSDSIINYTFDGKGETTTPRIFTHPVKIIHADDEPFVERVMEVSDHKILWQKRVACAKIGTHFIIWPKAETIGDVDRTQSPISCRYAREIQPVNPRIAEIESLMQELQNELETLKEVSK